MAGRKDTKTKVDGGIVKGVNDGKDWVCFKADKPFVRRIDDIGKSLGPVEIDRSKTIRLLLETMVAAVEAKGFDSVQRSLKRLAARKP